MLKWPGASEVSQNTMRGVLNGNLGNRSGSEAVFKVQIKVNQNAEGKEKQLRTQLVKFYVYIHLLVEYTPLSRKYLREVKCPKAQMWMEKKVWAGDPQV